MSFEPLHYLIGTLTVWHFAIWAALSILVGLAIPLRQKSEAPIKLLIQFAWQLIAVYGIFGLIFGQIFGDTYPFRTLAPSGLLIGFSFGLLFFFQADGQGTKKLPFSYAAFASVLAAVFFAFCIWLFPRVVGLGLINFPKLSWGVQL